MPCPACAGAAAAAAGLMSPLSLQQSGLMTHELLEMRALFDPDSLCLNRDGQKLTTEQVRGAGRSRL